MRHNVFVVEDDAAIRNAIRFVLADEGHTVSEAPDGAAALKMLRRASGPMIVVLDLMLPHMSGVQLLQKVGSDPELAHRLAFVVTSAARTFTIPDLGKYLHGGYLSVLPKPFNVDELAAYVEEAGRYLDVHAGV